MFFKKMNKYCVFLLVFAPSAAYPIGAIGKVKSFSCRDSFVPFSNSVVITAKVVNVSPLSGTITTTCKIKMGDFDIKNSKETKFDSNEVKEVEVEIEKPNVSTQIGMELDEALKGRKLQKYCDCIAF